MAEKFLVGNVKGQQGESGENGKDGISAYQVWLNEGNTGTEQDFLDSLKGTPGKDGVDGENGVDGRDGEPGKNGADGKDGVDGVNGKDGTNGIDGVDGKDGMDGEDGTDGFSPAIEVLTDTDTEYTLKITTADDEIETPNLKGADGTGAAWLSGTAAPATTLGNVGDWYLNTNSYEVFEKTAANTWTKRGMLGNTKTISFSNAMTTPNVPATFVFAKFQAGAYRITIKNSTASNNTAGMWSFDMLFTGQTVPVMFNQKQSGATAFTSEIAYAIIGGTSLSTVLRFSLLSTTAQSTAVEITITPFDKKINDNWIVEKPTDTISNWVTLESALIDAFDVSFNGDLESETVGDALNELAERADEKAIGIRDIQTVAPISGTATIDTDEENLKNGNIFKVIPVATNRTISIINANPGTNKLKEFEVHIQNMPSPAPTFTVAWSNNITWLTEPMFTASKSTVCTFRTADGTNFVGNFAYEY